LDRRKAILSVLRASQFVRSGVPQIYYSQETEILVANLNKPRALSQNLACIVDRSLAIYKKRLDARSFGDGPDILARTYFDFGAG